MTAQVTFPRAFTSTNYFATYTVFDNNTYIGYGKKTGYDAKTVTNCLFYPQTYGGGKANYNNNWLAIGY